MENPLSLPLLDRDGEMRRVARELAMNLIPIERVLETTGVSYEEFQRWQTMPRFQHYYQQFKEEWDRADNTTERTKIKAGLVMEDFMEEAYLTMHDKKQPLNHRVELAKLVAKVAGLGEPKVALGNGGDGKGGFSLTINISQSERVQITPQVTPKVINHAVEDFEEDDYDPFTSPVTIQEAAE